LFQDHLPRGCTTERLKTGRGFFLHTCICTSDLAFVTLVDDWVLCCTGIISLFHSTQYHRSLSIENTSSSLFSSTPTPSATDTFLLHYSYHYIFPSSQSQTPTTWPCPSHADSHHTTPTAAAIADYASMPTSETARPYQIWASMMTGSAVASAFLTRGQVGQFQRISVRTLSPLSLVYRIDLRLLKSSSATSLSASCIFNFSDRNDAKSLRRFTEQQAQLQDHARRERACGLLRCTGHQGLPPAWEFWKHVSWVE
jgi:hypothetical protein